MPKMFKSFQIPTGQDEANIPMIFEEFIKSGLKNGAVIAHFGTIDEANAMRAELPQGSFAWVQATLVRHDGVGFKPVWISPTMMEGNQRFETYADRAAYYSATGAGGYPPAAGQIAMVGANGAVHLTMFDGLAWQDHADLDTRNHSLYGGGTQATQVRLGVQSGFTPRDGWPVGVNGNMAVDGSTWQSGTMEVLGTSTLHGHVYMNNMNAASITATGNVQCNGNVNAGSMSTTTMTVGNRLNAWDGYIANLYGNDDNDTLSIHHWVNAYQPLVCHSNLRIIGSTQGGGALFGATTIDGPAAIKSTTVIVGTCYASGGFVHGSDSRLKSNITASPVGALDIVDSVPVKAYTMADQRSTYGWLAQDVETILPTAVVGTPNLSDEAGEPLKGFDGKPILDDDIKGLDVGEMTATLWAAVQELSAEVKSLRAQLESN